MERNWTCPSATVSTTHAPIHLTDRCYESVYSLFAIQTLAMSNDQKPYENITRVFWIKIELKEKPQNGRQVLGDIKDVISGEIKPIVGLFDIIEFIIPYIEKMGVQINWFWRIMSWYKSKSQDHSNLHSASKEKL